MGVISTLSVISHRRRRDMKRLPVKPKLIRWARERAGINIEDLTIKFKKLPEWESGLEQPTLKQAEKFAGTVHVPFEYLLFPEPPEEEIPIKDFRTFSGCPIERPSPNLLDTIYICQERQNWYRDFALLNHEPNLDFVNTVTVEAHPKHVAADMQRILNFDMESRQQCNSWTDALRMFIQKVDEAGILVMVSGIVKSNSRRALDPNEFRGFALNDPIAPLIFVNGRDFKAAQMFTLAHELAHVWLGATGLSNLLEIPDSRHSIEEIWCSKVAAEFLVPLDKFRSDLADDEPLPDTLSRLASRYKVSKLVILRRLFDSDWLTRNHFEEAWEQESKSYHRHAQTNGTGGDFYRTTLSRVGRRFASALVASTLEGQTLYRDAFWMLGINKSKALNRLGQEAGVLKS